jgi:hypothetical protein
VLGDELGEGVIVTRAGTLDQLTFRQRRTRGQASTL